MTFEIAQFWVKYYNKDLCVGWQQAIDVSFVFLIAGVIILIGFFIDYTFAVIVLSNILMTTGIFIVEKRTQLKSVTEN